jgi:hypothetical protein
VPTELANQLSPQFMAFLATEAQNRAEGNRRFVARNFLLDEGVAADRARTYAEFVDGTNAPSYDSWRLNHRSYLAEQVFVPREPAAKDGLSHQASNPESVAETFRQLAAFSRFGQAHGSLVLLRVEQTRHVASFAGVSERDLSQLAEAVVSGAAPDSAEWKQLDAALSRWQQLLQARPVYAGFLEYFADCFGATPDQDKPGWADELRDSLGLYHLVAGTSILVFRYQVQDIPKPRGRPDLRALAAPCVLDSDHSEAFCPSPANLNCGHAVDLQARGRSQPAGEVLHPWIRFEPRHVFRVGTIRRPVPASLDDARGFHLLAVRELAARANYAATTDADLLGTPN